MGLAICQKLACLLGGEIKAKSCVGQGSVFTLVLPTRCPEVPRRTEVDLSERETTMTVKQEKVERPEGGEASPSKPARVKPVVLVVEDNEVAALQVRDALEESGYAVTVADGGAKALEAVRRETPDAVILDLMMPEVDEFQVLDEIRSMTSTADMPVLVLTAKDLTVAERALLKRKDVQHLIQKGDVDRDELVARVEEMLRDVAAPKSTPTPTTEATEEVRVWAPPKNRTVLVVEDNPDNMLTIKAILDNIGCAYVTAEDGAEAVKATVENRPGLILMDIQLPVMSGLDATRRIKEDKALADTPVVALTARAMKGDREEILAAGCDDYLSKPLDPSKVEEVVRRWLGDEKDGS